MSDSPDSPFACPTCGFPLPTGSQDGICPRCVLAMALEPRSDSVAGSEIATEVDAPGTKPPPASGPTAYRAELPLPEELTTLLPHQNYCVEKFLGQGGMGAVYKGTQVRLQRTVAIKIMRRDRAADFGFEQRFQREALAMAKLNHPNIVNVIDFGEAGADFLYIVMEFVDGADLMDVIRTGRMTQEMALTLLPQICDALQFAHDHGIVHRDIKPSNIMLTRDGRVKMADFGLVKRFDADSSFRTQTGTGMGTPDYAAPEQFDVSAQVDHRADIYALGVMIYQMITGHLPRGVWRPPSKRADVHPQWDEIVGHAMQNDPKDRYQSASEVKIDVRKITPLPKGPEAKVKAGKSGNARAPLLLGGIIAATILVAGATFFLKRSPGEERQSASGVSMDVPLTLPEAASAVTPVSSASKETPFINALGMKFIPVPIMGGPTDKQRVLFSVWETRVQDYEVFAKDTNVAWLKAEFEQGPAHPAVHLSFNSATAFCEWLTNRERKAGKLGANEVYRLPSDHEWSCAIGIGDREDPAVLPAEKDERVKETPWGTISPPPANAGNYWSEELRPLLAAGKYSWIRGEQSGYRDGFAETAPVGSFPLNRYGLHDLSGNVWEFCNDWFDEEREQRVLRGAAWDNHGGYLRMSKRLRISPGTSDGKTGFRVVLAPSGLATSPALSPPITGTKNASFTNSLGMKFVSVPGTTIQLCIHETRRKDYEAFAAAVPNVDATWKSPLCDGMPLKQEDDHPVVMVSWEDAKSFCDWLGRKEGKRYRLPSDHEWNLAVVTGVPDAASLPPADLAKRLESQYPWGTDNMEDADALANYRGAQDDYGGTAPVMRFPANHLGVHDLGGNAWEWVQDEEKPGSNWKVIRGGSFLNFGPVRRSSWRVAAEPRYRAMPKNDYHRRVVGFRVALQEDEASVRPGSAIKADGSAAPATRGVSLTNSPDM